MRKAVFNAVVIASFIAVLGAIYYLCVIAVGAFDPFVPPSSPAPLPFLIP